MENEFYLIKEEIINVKYLNLTDYNKEIILRTDASNIGVGAVLYQKEGENIEKPIQWASKKLTPTEA